MPASLWCISHSHKHGRDIFHAIADGEPDPVAVIEAGLSSYDPDGEEEVSVFEVHLPPGSVLAIPAGESQPFILCN